MSAEVAVFLCGVQCMCVSVQVYQEMVTETASITAAVAFGCIQLLLIYCVVHHLCTWT